MKQIEQTITSLEVAEMVDKDHSKLLKDIRRYQEQLAEANFGSGDFFTKDSYKDANNQSRPCFKVTKKGCEFIAHKLTGVKGTEFTAKYINRFHEMEDAITRQPKPMSALEQINLTQQAVLEVDEKVRNVEADLKDFKESIPILGLDCQKITNAKNRKVVGLLGGKKSNAYHDKSIRGKVYSDLNGQLLREFGISTYKELKRNQCGQAIEVIDGYELPLYLEKLITECNDTDFGELVAG